MDRPCRMLWVPIPMRVVYRRRRARSVEITCVRHDTPVQIAAIGEETAPEVFHLVRDGVSVVYRDYGNALWRPLLDPMQRPLLHNAEVLATGSLDPSWNAQGREGWADNPFGVRLNVEMYPDGRAGPPGQLPRQDQLDGTVVSTNLNEIELAARRISTTDLIEIGGVLHRRTEPPVWAVGVGSYGVLNARSVEAVVPDLYPFDTGIARFAYDDRDLANDVLVSIRETFEARRRAMGIADTDLRVPAHEIVPLGPSPRSVDQTAMSLVGAVAKAEENLRGGALWRFPRSFLIRWGRLLDNVAGLGPHDKAVSFDRLESALLACREIVEDPPEFNDTWPAAAAAIQMLEAQIVRQRVEALRADQDIEQMPTP